MTALAPHRLLQLAIPAIAAVVGVIAGLSPVLGIAVGAAAVYLVITLENLAAGLALFVGVTFLEGISAFEALSLAKAAGALLAFSWIALVATRRDDDRKFAREHPGAAAALIALGAWVTISVAWSEFPAAALDGTQRWILNLVLFPIVFTAVRKGEHVRWVFVLFIVGALISASQGILSGAAAAAADPGRLEGNGINPNELGELLIVGVILAGALGACRDLASPARALAFMAAGVCLLALLMTVSRGAILGLVVALLVTPILIGPGRRSTALVLVVLAAAGGVGYFVVLAPASSVQRITQADTTGTGRTDIWKVGVRIVKARPLNGVGAGQYPTSTIHYLLEPGVITRSAFIIDDPKAAHNVYLQVLAELGVVGFALYLFVLGFALTSLLQAARSFARSGDQSMEVLSRALLIGLCGLLASAFFSTAVYSKQLWLLLALAVAVERLARERTALSAAGPRRGA